MSAQFSIGIFIHCLGPCSIFQQQSSENCPIFKGQITFKNLFDLHVGKTKRSFEKSISKPFSESGISVNSL